MDKEPKVIDVEVVSEIVDSPKVLYMRIKDEPISAHSLPLFGVLKIPQLEIVQFP